MTSPAVKPVAQAAKTGPAAKPAATSTAKTESPAAKASRTAPVDLDFAKLSAVKVDNKVVAPAPGAGRKAVDNSVCEGWVRDSWNSRKENDTVGEGRAVTVPTDAVVTLVGRLRKAVQTEGLGLAVKVIDGKDGKSTVNFAAKTAKKYAPRAKKADASES